MEKYKLPYHSISAKTGNNIESLFYAVVTEFMATSQ